jgi:hypothetical protein
MDNNKDKNKDNSNRNIGEKNISASKINKNKINKEKINRINNSKVIANNIKTAIDDTYRFKIKDVKIERFSRLIENNTKRKRELRGKYNCILESDIQYISPIFNKIRKYFYGAPMNNENGFIDGGLYVNCLPPRGHKVYKLFIVNFRFKQDLAFIDDIKLLLKSRGFIPFIEIRNNINSK